MVLCKELPKLTKATWTLLKVNLHRRGDNSVFSWYYTNEDRNGEQGDDTGELGGRNDFRRLTKTNFRISKC